MIPSWMLAGHKAMAESSMTDTCTIERSTVGQDAAGRPSTDWYTVATVKMRLLPEARRITGDNNIILEAFQPVLQGDKYAAQLRKNLERIKLPPGFKINLYAVVPDARHMAVGPQGVVTFVGTRKDAVWAMTDRNSAGDSAFSRGSPTPMTRLLPRPITPPRCETKAFTSPSR